MRKSLRTPLARAIFGLPRTIGSLNGVIDAHLSVGVPRPSRGMGGTGIERPEWDPLMRGIRGAVSDTDDFDVDEAQRLFHGHRWPPAMGASYARLPSLRSRRSRGKSAEFEAPGC